MYFKTTKESETGKKFQALIDRAEAFKKGATELAKEFGFTWWRNGDGCFASGFSGVHFDRKPDKKIWRKVYTGVRGEYMPRGNTKIGKEIKKRMDALERVHITELNECIGFKETGKTIGFDYNSDVFLFRLDEKWGFTPPADCQEITHSECQLLAASK